MNYTDEQKKAAQELDKLMYQAYLRSQTAKRDNPRPMARPEKSIRRED